MRLNTEFTTRAVKVGHEWLIQLQPHISTRMFHRAGIHTYTVRCISADGKSFTSGYDSKGTTVKYIAAPEISKLESVNGGVKISWGKVSGATKYRVYYKGSKGWTKMVDTTSTSYIDKDVSSGRNYTYTVRCITSDAKKFTSGYNPTGKSVSMLPHRKFQNLRSHMTA